MNGRPLRGYILVFALILILGIAGQSAAEMEIKPSSFIFNLASQASQTCQVMVTNTGKQNRTLKVEPEYWYQGSCRQPVEEWLHILPQTITLAPGKQCNVTMQFETPKELRGECMVMVFFAHEIIPSSISIRPRIGIPVYICKDRTQQLKAEITTFEVLPQKADQPQTFVMEISNLGNVHLLPFGLIQIRSKGPTPFQQSEFRFNEPIFPGQKSRIPIQFPKPITSGRHQATFQLFLDTLYTRDKAEPRFQTLTHQKEIILDEGQEGPPHAR